MRARHPHRPTAQGQPRWSGPGVLVATSTASTSAMALAVDPKGRIYLAWSELQADHSRVHVQVLEESGQLRWPVGGKVVALAHSSLVTPALAVDREGGFFTLWHSSTPATALVMGGALFPNAPRT